MDTKEEKEVIRDVFHCFDEVERFVCAAPNLLLNSCGLTLNIEDTYRRYVESLETEVRKNWLIACEAVVWWKCGGLLGWWRHHVTKLFLPRYYAKKKRWMLHGVHMQQQAILKAMVEEYGDI